MNECINHSLGSPTSLRLYQRHFIVILLLLLLFSECSIHMNFIFCRMCFAALRWHYPFPTRVHFSSMWPVWRALVQIRPNIRVRSLAYTHASQYWSGHTVAFVMPVLCILYVVWRKWVCEKSRRNRTRLKYTCVVCVCVVWIGKNWKWKHYKNKINKNMNVLFCSSTLQNASLFEFTKCICRIAHKIIQHFHLT